ncbi:MAG: hypothetical protein ACREE2_13255 [Stellaceae bacterium]
MIRLADGSFGVEVNIPDSHPTTVTSFSTAIDAEAWITEHQRRVQSQNPSNGWFRNSSRHRR